MEWVVLAMKFSIEGGTILAYPFRNLAEVTHQLLISLL
jgi:hypothetical protein